ncbi:hypothetical protein NLJ89_g11932 [Agrocybe chaxingu]|uniref:Uncharacterized protein n=1 Tax=Agrocybe chaxingu TaxID=84603 RepID=A0A9W8JKZ4_9AGAR|nr:hypothetical protein NLJ89_g11932 [Agrocybe chaxingu]
MMPSLFRSSSTGGHLPAPRTVRVTSVPPTDINISWKNVTHLELQSVEDSGCFAILQQAPRLVSCKFLQVLPDSAPPLPTNASSASLPSPTPTVLLHLKFFQYSNGNRPRAFASGFTFPALEELSLNVDHGHLPSMSLISLLMRSNAPLRTLELVGWTNDDEEGLLGLLHLVPNLEELHICPSPLNPRGVSERFFQAFSTLQPRNHAGLHDRQKCTNTFLPNLKKLEYQGRVTFSWSVLRCLLPYAFSPQIPGSASNTKEDPTRRPLHMVRLELGMHRTNFIDKDVVLRLLEAQGRFGMVWSIFPASQRSDHGMFMNASDSLPPDLLLASMEHHQIRIEGEDG